MIIEARRRITGRRTFFPLIGVTRGPFADGQSELHLTEGRTFRPGLHELIASSPCARQFTGFAIGDKRPIGGADWTVVGHYDEGDVQQCVVLADAEILMSAFKSNTYTQATATLKSVADYPVLQRALEQNPTLHLEVRHEAEAREEGIRQLNGLLNFAAYFVGSIMAIGATLGAVNSLYSIVDSRRREIATLRAADLILVLKDGRRGERGRYEELVQLGGVFAELDAQGRFVPDADPAAAEHPTSAMEDFG